MCNYHSFDIELFSRRISLPVPIGLDAMSSSVPTKSETSKLEAKSSSTSQDDDAKAAAFAKSVVRILFISLVLDLVWALFNSYLCLSGKSLLTTPAGIFYDDSAVIPTLVGLLQRPVE